MPQLLPDHFFDDDPLSGFTTEPDPPAEIDATPEAAEPVGNVEVAPAEEAVAPAEDPALIAMRERIDRVETALHESTAQVQSLKSEVATLVGAIADIKRHVIRRPTFAPLPAPAVAARRAPRAPRALPAIAGVVLGVALAAWGWSTWSREPVNAIASTPAQLAAPEQAAPQQAAPAPPPAAVATPVEVPVAPTTPARDFPARQSHIVPASSRIEYVGTLSIDASPGGQVFLNRQPAGRTPLRLANLKAGSHLIWIERDGYRRFTRVVQVPADRVTRLSAELEPIAER